MKAGKVLLIVGVALLLLGVFSGCKKTEKYVEGLEDKLAEAEKLEDELLVRELETAAGLSILGGNGITWNSVKEHLAGESRAYLEGLEQERFSGEDLVSSIDNGGWIKVRQGWITISRGDCLHFAYTQTEP